MVARRSGSLVQPHAALALWEVSRFDLLRALRAKGSYAQTLSNVATHVKRSTPVSQRMAPTGNWRLPVAEFEVPWGLRSRELQI